MTAQPTEQTTPQWADQMINTLGTARCVGFGEGRTLGTQEEIIDAAWMLARYRFGQSSLDNPLPAIRRMLQRALNDLDQIEADAR